MSQERATRFCRIYNAKHFRLPQTTELKRTTLSTISNLDVQDSVEQETSQIVADMSVKHPSVLSPPLHIAAGALVLLGLYLTSLRSYSLFQFLVEIFSIIVSFTVFAVAWNSRQFTDNSYLPFIGIAFLFVGIMDLLRILIYDGMIVLPGDNANIVAQLRVAARYIHSASLLVAPLLVRRRLGTGFLFLGFATVTSALLTSILSGFFPVCVFTDGSFSEFRTASEYAISLTFVASVFTLFLKRKEFDSTVYQLLMTSSGLAVGSEMLSALYVGTFEFVNMAGHFLGVLMSYLFYKALVEISLFKPYDVVFRNLKLSEEQFKLERDKAQTYLDSVDAILIALDADGMITFVNGRGRELLGTNTEKVLGKNWFDTYLPTEIRDNVKRRFQSLVKGRAAIPDLLFDRYETSIRDTNGVERLIAWHNTVLKDGDGRVVGILSSGNDITERKTVERDTTRYTQLLEELVAERTRKLRQAERLAAIGELASMVGHDLRNPLQVIFTQLYLAKEYISAMPDAERAILEKVGLAKMWESLGKQVEYMNKVVSDLQDYARTIEPKIVEVNLRDLVVDTLSSMTIPPNIKVSLMIDERFHKVIIDPALMKRVFTNLISNGVQAMPDGGQLTVKASWAAETASIDFQDTGVGIPEENLDKLFQPLFTTKAKGQGLGLAVCRRIVEAHGGIIKVESKVKEGSTFTIKLPHEKRKERR